MSAPRFELVQTDAGFHSRTIAANGEPVLTSEVHPRREDARNAIRITAQLFSVTPVYFDEDDGVMFVHAAGMRVELRDVDQRTAHGTCTGTDCPGCQAGRRHYNATGCLEPGCTDAHEESKP